MENLKDTKLHMIGNAHLDPVWLWNWQEGFQEAKATFQSALDRMEEDENFVFTCSSAAFYEWVEKNLRDDRYKSVEDVLRDAVDYGKYLKDVSHKQKKAGGREER